MLFLLISTAFASTGSVVVDTVDHLSLAQLQELKDEAHLASLEWVDTAVADEGIAVGLSTDTDETLQLLRANPLVESAELDFTFSVPTDEEPTRVGVTSPNGSPNDPDYSKQWHMRDPSIDAEWVWSNTKSGKDVTVAVLDTGFTMTKDFNPSHVKPGKSFISGQPVDDWHGHGTHCANTIAEWTDNGYGVTGLANQVTILPVKVLSDSGSGSLSGIIAGIDWAADQGVDVISMSLGGPSHSEAMAGAIRRANQKGVVVVVAAGNDNSSRFGSPGDIPEATTVGALGPKGDRAYYSNYGPKVDVFAPGGDKKFDGGGVFQITSHQGVEDLYEWQGTSMATPHVAAAVAVLLGEGACADASDRQVCIDKLLVDTATPKTGASQQEYGKGVINLKKAVETSRGKTDTVVATTPIVTNDGSTLPWPSPAGNFTYVVAALSVLTGWFMSRVYSTSGRFSAGVGVASLASAGSLYGLTLLPFNTHALSMFMVPWLEFPEFILGPGMSGFPLWMSVLPLVPVFMLFTPFRILRPVVLGLSASAFAYFALDSVLQFNPVWGLGAVGDSIWLGVNALSSLGMMFIAFEWEKRAGEIHG